MRSPGQAGRRIGGQAEDALSILSISGLVPALSGVAQGKAADFSPPRNRKVPMSNAEVTPRPVTPNAVYRRLKRRLGQDGEQLRRAGQWTSDTGDYYVVDLHQNAIVCAHVDPEKLAQELGLLRPGEFIE